MCTIVLIITFRNSLSTCISTKCNNSAKNSPTKRIIAYKNQDFPQPLVISQSKDKNNTNNKFFSVKSALFETHVIFNHGKYNNKLVINKVAI